MRFFFAVLALVAAVSAASLQRRQSFPTCSESCLTNANFGSCDPLDDSCLCHDSGFVSSVTNCIVGACSGSDLTTAEAAAQQLCLAVGVTLTASSTVSGSASATGSAAGSATATSPASGSGSASASAASSTATTTSGSNGAASHGVNALAALAAVGAVALAL
ncbi:hypothetical protein GSI_09187 [Ganoderma sinense ZZ0214-1]|uniref:CFEM domain-containing protein n=1 Tax=Ganoderma sinense ZZ0214-1 TaxID=1077348 RepID=A0A2G8S6H2_9APHY|nr:hypothetical protein GSI_09187 [Ganoderma sinense ZZ0214-1]